MNRSTAARVTWASCLLGVAALALAGAHWRTARAGGRALSGPELAASRRLRPPAAGPRLAPADRSALASISAGASPAVARAFSRALAASDPRLRLGLIHDALADWAKVSPFAAAAWTRSQSLVEPWRAIDALMSGAVAGAAGQPADAVTLAQRWAAEDPGHAWEYGTYLISALDGAGHFTLAADFAARSPEGLRRDMVIPAFYNWAREQPDAAVEAAAALPDPGFRETAFQAAASGWAMTDPERLAETALGFPEGAEKTRVLTKAVGAWMAKDPDKAGDWILSHPAAIAPAQAAFSHD